MSKAKKYYAIKEGKGVRNIILNSWGKCQPLVTGYNAVYKSFKTEEEAKDYLKNITEQQAEKIKEITTRAIKQKKEKKISTISVQARIPKELYEKFLKRCEVMGLDDRKILQSLIQETFEEWTDDVE